MAPRQPARKGTILVFGMMFAYPMAGMVYQQIHYLSGLRRLGYDAYYVEDSSRWVYDPRLGTISPDADANVAIVAPVLRAHGFGERWAYRGHYPGGTCYGMREVDLLRLYRTADALLNVTGSQEIREEHLACPRRIYVESDPFADQVRVAQGNAARISELDAHDTHFSFGENLGAPDCSVPITRYTWLPTRQPVDLDLWASDDDAGDSAYTTITTWRNKGKDIDYLGETYYWTKDREFERLIDLPRHTPVRMELATLGDDELARMLRSHGWEHTDAAPLSQDAERYRAYIQRSRGEFTVARDQYYRPNTGWFSDRSACYLAAGRPVITQETGFSTYIPTGRGLFAFRTQDEALAAIEAIEADYAGHSRAAREIAAEYFAAEKVVGSLMARAGL